MRIRLVLAFTLFLGVAVGLTFAGRMPFRPRPPSPPPGFKAPTPFPHVPQVRPFEPLPAIKPWAPSVALPQRTQPPAVAWANARNVAVKSMPELRLTWSSRYHPTEALKLLSKGTQASKLPEAQHRQLLRESVNQIALLAEGAREPWGLLARVQPAPGGTVPKNLTPVQAKLGHQVIREGLDIGALYGRKEGWGEAHLRAETWLNRTGNLPESIRTGAEYQKVREHLDGIRSLSRQEAQLEKLVGELQPGRPPQQVAEALARIDLKQLPKTVQAPAEGLRGLAKIEAALTQRGRSAPDAAGLREALWLEFRQNLQGVKGEQAEALVRSLQQELALRAFLDGFPEAARQLWPQNAEPGHAAQVLRDMKNLASGQGEVTTTAARTSAEPGQLPPGLRPLLPEAARTGWRPPTQGRVTEGLPPLQEAQQHGGQLREVLVKRLEQERTATTARIQPHVQALNLLQQGLHKREAEERQQLQQVEKRIELPLQPLERAQAWHLLRQGKSVAAVVQFLEEQLQQEEVDEDLDQLKTYLAPGMTLTKEQITDLRRALREGKDLTEVLLSIRNLLRPELLRPGINLGEAVRLDEIARRLQPGPDGFELAQAQALLQQGEKSAQVVRILRKHRLRQEAKYNLERVKSYLDRPLTDEELKKVRAELEAKKEVAEVLTGLAEALPPERRQVAGGIKTAVYLDEINAELDPNLDGAEYQQARQLLLQGSKPSEVVVSLASQRAEAFERLVQQRLPTAIARIRWRDQWGNQISLPENVRNDVLELLRSGVGVDEVVTLYNR